MENELHVSVAPSNYAPDDALPDDWPVEAFDDDEFEQRLSLREIIMEPAGDINRRGLTHLAALLRKWAGELDERAAAIPDEDEAMNDAYLAKSAPHPAPAARGIGFRALAAVLWLGGALALSGCALRDDGRTEWVWPTFGL